MALYSRHPDFDAKLRDWIKIRDCYSGEDAVKSCGAIYLPPTSGQVFDGADPGDGTVCRADLGGRAEYGRYRARASFPGYVRLAVETALGFMHREPARIELPERMKSLMEDATPQHESIQTLLRKINRQQLIYGRCGLLVEVPTGKGPDVIPYLVLYTGPSILNWDDGERQSGTQRINLVVLDEQQHERDDNFDWILRQNYRVLFLGDGGYRVAVIRNNRTEFDPAVSVLPQIAGTAFADIPFTFINAEDTTTDVGVVPFMDICNLSLSIYRQDADYKQGLHMQGQETLVIVGADKLPENQRTGAGARIDLPRDSDARYIGVSADGLAEMREALRRDHEIAASMANHAMNAGGVAYQSGEAKKVQIATQTATLTTIAKTGAEGLRHALRQIAVAIGEDPEEVIVEPNTEFTEPTLVSRTLLELAQAKTIGAPISQESLHRFMQQNDLTLMSLEEELRSISGEETVISTGGLDENAQQAAVAAERDRVILGQNAEASGG